jgi:hypothetical protein
MVKVTYQNPKKENIGKLIISTESESRIQVQGSKLSSLMPYSTCLEEAKA